VSAGVGVAIGVDAGASSTLALLVDDACDEIRRASAGGANVRVLGRERAASELRKAIEPLVASSPDLRAVCVGAAGSDRDDDRRAMEAIVRAIIPNSAHVIVCHDGRIALEAFTSARPALAIIAGTGSFVFGEDRQQRGVRGGGWGPVIGDPGSGYSLGLAAVRHLAKALDGIMEHDDFSDAVAAHLGVRSPADLVELVQRWPPDLVRIADLARLVGDACSRGSREANEIVDAEARGLFAIAEGVARAIGDGIEPIRACLTGGAYSAVPELARSLTDHMTRAGFTTSRLTVEPALGAARLALCARPKG
jgi:N-acetylglucosamine kinase-like BadF-type ATPase